MTTKDIEELATNAVKKSVLTSGYLSQYISENDKGPSWDGFIYIYNNEQKRKTDYYGRVAVQIKGSCQKDHSAQIGAVHHATTTYFTPHLPQCGVILASNGRPNKGHGSWHKICYHYGSFYQSHKGVKMLCSNLRCDLGDLPETPNCNNCSDQNYVWNGDSVTIISP